MPAWKKRRFTLLYAIVYENVKIHDFLLFLDGIVPLQSIRKTFNCIVFHEEKVLRGFLWFIEFTQYFQGMNQSFHDRTCTKFSLQNLYIIIDLKQTFIKNFCITYLALYLDLTIFREMKISWENTIYMCKSIHYIFGEKLLRAMHCGKKSSR